MTERKNLKAVSREVARLSGVGKRLVLGVYWSGAIIFNVYRRVVRSDEAEMGDSWKTVAAEDRRTMLERCKGDKAETRANECLESLEPETHKGAES